MNKYEGAHRECQAELERMDYIKNVRKKNEIYINEKFKIYVQNNAIYKHTHTHTKDCLANRTVGYRRKGNAEGSGCQAERAKPTLHLPGPTC